MGSSPRPTILSAHDCILMNTSPVVGCQNRWVAVTADLMISSRFITSLGRMLVTDGRPLPMGSSPHRACVISANPGRGYGGLLSDCSGITSQGGVVGMSIFVVAVDWLSQVTDREPLGWVQLLQLWLWPWLQSGLGSHGMGSISLGKLTSVQLEGVAAVKTPTCLKETIGSVAHWSFHHTFCQTVRLARDWWFCPSQPNTVTPLHRQWNGVIG